MAQRTQFKFLYCFSKYAYHISRYIAESAKGIDSALVIECTVAGLTHG